MAVPGEGEFVPGASGPMDGQDVSVMVHNQGEAIVMEVHGEVDLLTAPQMRETVMAAVESQPRVLVIDLLGVSFLGSPGLAVLVEAQQRAGTRTQLRVAAVGAATVRPMLVSGLNQQLALYPTREAALAG